MSPAKKFLLQLAVISLVGTTAVNIVWGPPGMSSEYMAEYKAEHDHYVAVLKSIPYKKYIQRPELNGPGSDHWNDTLAANVAFVEEYTSRDAFKAEQRRRSTYYLIFEVFNALILIVLIVRFAKDPLLNFLDNGIRELRDKIEAAANARREAEKRKQEAEGKLAGLPEEKEQLDKDTEERLAKARAELEKSNAHSIEVLEREAEDRKQEEYHQAALLVKQELVNQTIDELEAQYRQAPVVEKQAELLNQFTAAVEKHS